MPIETVGSAEAILQLVASFQGLEGKGPDPLEIWSRIVRYTSTGGTFKFYPLIEYNPEKPAGEFLLDITDLLKRGLLQLLPDGRIELTSLGRCFTFAKTLPVSLTPLEKDMVITS